MWIDSGLETPPEDLDRVTLPKVCYLIDTHVLCDERIALARGYFNDIAAHYNTRLQTVPERWVARLGAMSPQALMAANAFERAPVTVELREPQAGSITNPPSASESQGDKVSSLLG